MQRQNQDVKNVKALSDEVEFLSFVTIQNINRDKVD
jgi:hypothetical protein